MTGTVLSANEYNAIWEQMWYDMAQYGPLMRHIRRNLLDLVRPLAFDSVLDVGCGQGALLADVRAEFPAVSVHGADFSSAAVRLAKRQLPDGHFCVFDLEHDRLHRQFDVVFCSEVIEHIPNDRAALQNLAAMTRKYLAISTVQGKMRHFERHVGHVRNYAYGELVQKVEETGLRVRKVVEWGFPFYSPLYRDFLNLTDRKGVDGTFGAGRKLIASIIYGIFSLNSSRSGDEIFVLAERP
jgi:trans-aconitate methyltransferase